LLLEKERAIMADDWYIRINNVDRGPLSSRTLKQLAVAGIFTPETLLKKGSSGHWSPASHVKGLFPQVAEQAVPQTAPSAPRAEPAMPLPAVPPQVEDESTSLSRTTLLALWSSVAVFALGCILFLVWYSHSQDQEKIAAANQEVRQAVEKADKWIQDSSLADADQIEQGLNAAEVNAVATQKTSIGPTLVAFRKTKAERQATAILDSAFKAITEKQFDKASASLGQYLQDPSATEKQRARTLLSEIALATWDEDALRTLLAMDDQAFTAFSNGGAVAAVPSITHPVLIETRLGTLKKNLPEASRQREEKRKKAEAQRIAEQERTEAEKKAAALARAQQMQLEMVDMTKAAGISGSVVRFTDGPISMKSHFLRSIEGTLSNGGIQMSLLYRNDSDVAIQPGLHLDVYNAYGLPLASLSSVWALRSIKPGAEEKDSCWGELTDWAELFRYAAITISEDMRKPAFILIQGERTTGSSDPRQPTHLKVVDMTKAVKTRSLVVSVASESATVGSYALQSIKIKRDKTAIGKISAGLDVVMVYKNNTDTAVQPNLHLDVYNPYGLLLVSKDWTWSWSTIGPGAEGEDPCYWLAKDWRELLRYSAITIPDDIDKPAFIVIQGR
jgi:hypothetical protein